MVMMQKLYILNWRIKHKLSATTRGAEIGVEILFFSVFCRRILLKFFSGEKVEFLFQSTKMGLSQLPDNVLLKVFRSLNFKEKVRIDRVDRRFREISEVAISETKFLNL